MAPSLLLVRTGIPDAPLLRTAGGYDVWFQAGFGVDRVRLTCVDPFRGESLRRAADFDGIVCSGSPLSVTDRDHWMTPTGEYLIEAAQQGRSVLAVCFGHQLVAQTLGAPVMRNPVGREIGTVDVELTDAGSRDPLFADLGRVCRFQCTHSDAVLEVPRGAELLASNAHGIQALAVGERLRTVQFHPELDPKRMRAVIESREEALAAEGLLDRARSSVGPTPMGAAILENYLCML